jgi:hypothetical protein
MDEATIQKIAAKAKQDCPLSGASPEEIQRLARERWQEYRRGRGADQRPAQGKPTGQGQDRSHGEDDDQSL